MVEWDFAFIAVTLLGLAVVALHAFALIQIAAHATLTTAERVGWIVAVLFISLFGAIVWFVYGRDGTAVNWLKGKLGDTPKLT